MIDEAHEGIDTYRTDAAFDRIRRSFTLHLSGTPFKALANDIFPTDAIYNWTYADEQAAMRDWDGEDSNSSPTNCHPTPPTGAAISTPAGRTPGRCSTSSPVSAR